MTLRPYQVALVEAVVPAASGLARIGWELRVVEVDLVARRVDVQAHHESGRWVHLRIEDRGAILERWQRETPLARPQGGGPSCNQVVDTFLGRVHVSTGARSAMRALADYMSDHAHVGRQVGRDFLRPVLAGLLGDT